MPRKKKVHRRERFTGSITRRPDGKADLRWYENGIRQKKKGVPGNLADKILSDIMHRIREGKSGIESFCREFKTVDEYAQRWFSLRLTSANRHDQARYELHMRPEFGHLPPSAIMPGFIREFISKKRRTNNGGGVTLMVRIMSSMFTDMAEDGVIEFNPFKSLGSKSRAMMKTDYDTKTAPWLNDPAKIPQLFTEMKEPTNYFFVIGIMTGMRPGEIRGLDWAHVDWERRRITVLQQAHEDTNELTRCKDRDSRVVPILPELYPLLREWWEKCGAPTEGLVFGPQATGRSVLAAKKRAWVEEWYRAHLPGKLPTIKDAVAAMKERFDGAQIDYADHMALRLMLQGKSPRVLKAEEPAESPSPKHRERKFIGISLIRDEWHRACKAVGLKPMRLYDGGRHSFATWWLVSGGTRDEIKDLLGHSDLKTTERYVHMAKTFAGDTDRKLFGMDASAVQNAIRDHRLGLMWKIEGREEPKEESEEESAADAI
jgi:integrase